jgi:hypothetical protein
MNDVHCVSLSVYLPLSAAHLVKILCRANAFVL